MQADASNLLCTDGGGAAMLALARGSPFPSQFYKPHIMQTLPPASPCLWVPSSFVSASPSYTTLRPQGHSQYTEADTIHSTFVRSAKAVKTTMMESPMAQTLVVFDFDKTIIDCDSDNWVIDGFGITDLFNSLLPTMRWNPLMDRMMLELHSRGEKIQDIVNCLINIPLHPSVATAIKSAYALGCELKILSDANMFFIETILKHHGLHGYFSEIITNPSFVDDIGRLRILPYHELNNPHGCGLGLCPPNMCKGLVLEQVRASLFGGEEKRFVYIGDGTGDYCPSLKLGVRDCVMPRRNFPLYNLITGNPSAVKAEICEWSHGDDLKFVLLQLVNKTLISGKQLGELSQGCKFTTVPTTSQIHSSTPLDVIQ